jgi:hypothetical protein
MELGELKGAVATAERLAESAFEDRRRGCPGWLAQPARAQRALEAAYAKIADAKRLLAVPPSGRDPDALAKDLEIQRRAAGAALVRAGEARALIDEEKARHETTSREARCGPRAPSSTRSSRPARRARTLCRACRPA